MYFRLNIHLKYILIGRNRAVKINTINKEYRAAPNCSKVPLSFVLANKGGKIKKYPRSNKIPQISRNKIFSGNHLFVMIIFRFIGFVPFFIANLLPVIFNINIKNYFFGTFIGIIPSVFILSSLGNGLSIALFQFETFPSILTLLILPDIYLPLLGFGLLIIISFFFKNSFNK